MSESKQVDIATLAEGIRKYLLANLNAAETVEGIREWWLARERIDVSIEAVQSALDELEQRGIVEKLKVAGERKIYQATKPK